MSNYYLGKNFDFHGGGEDLAFPHHHNEIAQNYGGECCGPTSLFVHNGLVNVNGSKMSKSLGNIISIQDLVKNTYDGDVLRYIFISTYYSSPVNFTKEIWQNGINIIDKFRKYKFSNQDQRDVNNKEVLMEHMLDDLNMPKTFYALCSLMKNKANYNLVINTLELCGFKLEIRTTLNENQIEVMIKERELAKAQNNILIVREIENTLKNNFVQLANKDKETMWYYL
jgi:cysteinyl-tRNA synthetase